MRCTEPLEMQITPAITFVFLCHVFIEKNSLILLIIAWPFAVLVNGRRTLSSLLCHSVLVCGLPRFLVPSTSLRDLICILVVLTNWWSVAIQFIISLLSIPRTLKTAKSKEVT